MTNYEWCKKAWINGWATETQLQVWVQSGKITQADYDEITALPKLA